jgi:hypothetical protein
LHDSNFDGAQDLWRLEDLIDRHPLKPGQVRYTCIHGDVPAEAIRFPPTPPPADVIVRMLKQRSEVNQQTVPIAPIADWKVELVVMRGLGVPAPWTRMYGSSTAKGEEDVIRLLAYPPNEFLTPTLAIYRQ